MFHVYLYILHTFSTYMCVHFIDIIILFIHIWKFREKINVYIHTYVGYYYVFLLLYTTDAPIYNFFFW